MMCLIDGCDQRERRDVSISPCFLAVLARLAQRRTTIVTLVLVVGCRGTVSLGDEPSTGSGDDLSHVRSAFEFMHSAKVSMRIAKRRTSRLQSEPVLLQYEVECLREGDRWGSQTIQPMRKTPTKFRRTNFIFRAKDAVQFNSVCDGEHSRLPDEYLSATMHSQKVSGSRKSFDRFRPTGTFDAFGYGIVDGQPICSSKGLLADAKVGGVEDGQIVIQGDSRFGKIKMWCDPGKRYLPRRVTFVQHPEHYSRGRRIADIVMNAGNVWPAGKINSIQWEINTELSALKSALDRPYIKQWTIVKKTHCEEGVVVTTSITGKVTEITLNQAWKDDDFLFGLDVTPWTPVHVRDASHLSYVWDGEWAVPAVEGLAPSDVEANGVAFWYVVGAGVVLLVALGGLWAFKYVKSRSG